MRFGRVNQFLVTRFDTAGDLNEKNIFDIPLNRVPVSLSTLVALFKRFTDMSAKVFYRFDLPKKKTTKDRARESSREKDGHHNSTRRRGDKGSNDAFRFIFHESAALTHAASWSCAARLGHR